MMMVMIEEAGKGWLDSNVMLWFVWGQSTVVNNGAEPWIFFCSESPKRRLGTGQTGTIHSVHWLAGGWRWLLPRRSH